MLAAFYERTGPARDVLQVGEMPDPQPGRGEVRVRLRWSGVNPSDVKSRAGLRSSVLTMGGLVEQQCRQALEALVKGDEELARTRRPPPRRRISSRSASVPSAIETCVRIGSAMERGTEGIAASCRT